MREADGNPRHSSLIGTKGCSMKELRPQGLRDLPAFCELPTRALDKLLARMSVAHVPAKAELLKEGCAPDTLFVLLDGLVQLFTTRDDGRKASVAILRPPAFFPVEAVLRSTVVLTSARCVQPCLIGRMAADRVHVLIRRERQFAAAITDGLASRLEDMLRELKNMRARSSFQRLVAWILAMQMRADRSLEFEVPYDKSVLAARLGMAPETLSRDLARLAAWGVVVDGRRVTIKDPSALRQLTKVDELTRPSVP